MFNQALPHIIHILYKLNCEASLHLCIASPQRTVDDNATRTQIIKIFKQNWSEQVLPEHPTFTHIFMADAVNITIMVTYKRQPARKKNYCRK